MSRSQTPLGTTVRGIAGVVGTGVMTLAQTLPAKLETSAVGSPDQETSEQHGEQDPWEQASAPAKVAKRISEGIFHHEVAPERIPLLTHGMHWSYGTGWGAVYGLTHGSAHPAPLRHGVLFGTAVWAISYVQLVPMGLYELPWKYAPDIAMEVGYHLAYGLGVAGTFRMLRGH